MSRKNQIYLAVFLILLGGIYIVANFLNIDPGDFFWPLLLIVLGSMLIFRPKVLASENAKHYFAGDIHVGKDWQAVDEEVRMFAGDIDIDLQAINLPEGETTYRVRFFAGDITVFRPKDVGLKIESTGFVVDAKFDGDANSHVMTGYEYVSDNYDSAAKKFILNTASFAVDLKIRSV